MSDLGSRLRGLAGRAPAPSPDLAPVARRAKGLRFRRRGGAAVATVVVAALGVAAPLALLSGVDHPVKPRPPGPGTSASPTASTSAQVIHDFGLSLPLPDGWDGRVYFNPDEAGPTMQAASLQLRPIGAQDDDLASATRGDMGPDDIVVVLQELSDLCPCASFLHADLPVSLTVFPDGGGQEGVDRHHSAGRLTFTTGGRWFDLRVEIGSSPPPQELADQASRVLAGLQIEPSETPSSRSGWKTHLNPLNGMSIDVPETWVVRNDLVPSLLEPKIVIAAGNYARLYQGGDCGPDNALADLPPDGVLLWVLRYDRPNGRAPYEFRPRGESVDLGPLLGPFECIGRRTYLVLFRDGGGFFQAHVVLGPDAPDALRDEAAEALATFAAPEDPAVEAELAACRSGGPWTVCPDAAWLYRAAGDAGFAGNGDTGSALMFAGRGAEFYLWSTEESDHATAGQDGYEEVARVGDTVVLGDGVRLTWQTQGFSVWVEAGPHEDSELPTSDALADLVRATEATPFVPDR